MGSRDEYKFKSLRDSIHGYIGVSETELEIMNTRAMRRLHGVLQLSFSYLAYHTATHTRYEHSIGAMHMASRMCDQLGVDEDLKRLARMAALLHDVGHGPFSHTFEHVLKNVDAHIPHKPEEQMHERVGKMIISEDPEISDCLGDDRHDIVKILGRDYELDDPYNLVSDIVSSNLDADKLDYFARDSYNLGVKYGVVDTERILHVLRQDRNGSYVGVHPKGVPAIDSYRLARYMIGRQIYSHRVRLAADQMFYHAARAAFDEGVLDVRDFDSSSGSFLEFYTGLDDSSFVHRIMSHKDSGLSSEILDSIKSRRLLKTCYQGNAIGMTGEPGEGQTVDARMVLLNATADIRERLGLREHELVAYESDLQVKLFHRRDFQVIDEHGQAHDLMALSPMRAHPSVLSHYVFGLAGRREEITQELANKGIVTSPMT